MQEEQLELYKNLNENNTLKEVQGGTERIYEK